MRSAVISVGVVGLGRKAAILSVAKFGGGDEGFAEFGGDAA